MSKQDGMAEPWGQIRRQLSFRQDRILVIVECPECAYYIGAWPEGGMVQPPRLFWGEYVCPRCGWKPLMGGYGGHEA